MNPSRATIATVTLQSIVAAIMSWNVSREVCGMLNGIGHDPAKDDFILGFTRIMGHGLFPITVIVLIAAVSLIALRVRADRLPWAAFGFVLGGSLFLFGVIMLLFLATAAIGPKML